MSNISDVNKLHQAIRDDDAKLVSSLIESGADVNIIFQQETAFTHAVEGKYFHAADAIISSKQFDPHSKNQFDRSPLFVAAKVGRVDYIKTLLNMGALVNDADIRGNTPLSSCTWYDNHEAANVLIQHGANVNQPDNIGQSPLYRACSNVSLKVVKLLLQHNCDVNQATQEKKSPLMAALPSFYNCKLAFKKISDMLCICEMIIKAGGNINYQDHKGKTPLHLAVEADDIYGTCLLVENGCELNIKDDLGYTPFQTAILLNKRKYDIARYLVFYGADVTQEIKLPNGASVSPLCMVLHTKEDNSTPDIKWPRALLLRALWRSAYPNRSIVQNYEHDHISVSGFPLEMKYSIHEFIEGDILEWLNSCVPCSLQYQTLLKLRGILGSSNIIPKINLLPIAAVLKQYLLLGIRPSSVPLSTTCDLHMFITDRNNEKVKDMVESGTDLNIPIYSKTPLALSLEIGNIEAAEMMLRNFRRPFLSILNSSGDNALHIAAKYGRDEVIYDIFKICSDINSKNFQDHTPLQEAIFAGHFTTAVILINKGADVHVQDSNNMPLLHLAAASGADNVVRLFLDKGLDPNMEDKYRNTPLHVAASKGHEYLRLQIPLPGLYEDDILASWDTIQMTLTNCMPQLTKKDTHHAKVIEYLIKGGADSTRLNFESRTPRQCSEHFKTMDLLTVLNVNTNVSEK